MIFLYKAAKPNLVRLFRNLVTWEKKMNLSGEEKNPRKKITWPGAPEARILLLCWVRCGVFFVDSSGNPRCFSKACPRDGAARKGFRRWREEAQQVGFCCCHMGVTRDGPTRAKQFHSTRGPNFCARDPRGAHGDVEWRSRVPFSRKEDLVMFVSAVLGHGEVGSGKVGIMKSWRERVCWRGNECSSMSCMAFLFLSVFFASNLVQYITKPVSVRL